MDKNAIRKFATWARRELIDRVRQQAYRYEVETKDADPLASSARGVVLTVQQRSQRQALIERMQIKGYDATIEEVAYTWFDRFCALRFMEVNAYLPGKTRMFSDVNGAFRPQILTDALSLELGGINEETVIQLKESNQNEELYKYLLQIMCNILKPVLMLFQPDDRSCVSYGRDYTWLLLPDNLLREGSVLEQMVTLIPEDDWKDAVQIVGWLYQYYNAEPKDQVFANLKKNIKISKKDIPAATQLFTPDWIVRYMVENSLGRLWVEGHPNDQLKSTWRYYLEEAEQEPDVQIQLAKIREDYETIKPEEILCIYPCMGSGHILVYMFDVLIQIYEDYGYPTRDAVASIVQNNLWGLDIDDRATQLANFAVMMKARQYDKLWFKRGIQPHVMSVQESNDINRNHLQFLGNSMSDFERNNAMTQMEALLDEFVDAKEYGSILQPKEYDWELLHRFVSMTAQGQQITMDEAGIEGTQEKLMQIIEQGRALSQKYHVVVTNPPYMNPGNAGNGIAEYVKKHYPDSKSDLFAVFIEQCSEMLGRNGIQSMITMHAWMFLESYERLRNKIYNRRTISLVHLGARAFEEIGGEVVQTCAFVIANKAVQEYNSKYIRLLDYNSQKSKENAFLNGREQYISKCNRFIHIPGSPVAYWYSKQFYDCFDIGNQFMGDTKKGILSGDTGRFLRFWYEVAKKDTGFGLKNVQEMKNSAYRWFPITSGGANRKWYGNLDNVINMYNGGEEIVKYARNYRLRDSKYYMLEALTWTQVSTALFAVRYVPEGVLMGDGGPVSFFSSKLFFHIGLLNSIVTESFLKCLAPGLNYGPEQIKRIPVIINNDGMVSKIVEENIVKSKKDWDSFENSWDFQQHPMIRLKSVSLNEMHDFESNATGFKTDNVNYVRTVERAYMTWKAEAENRFVQLKANEEELNRIFIEIYGLQDELTPEVADKDVTVRKADLSREIRSLISYAVGCMLGRYSLDKPGLQFAGGNWQEWMASQDNMSYVPDTDGILPITDDEYFSDDIVSMFVNWLRVAFGAETLEENLKYIASALYPSSGGSAREAIRQYFLNDFYKDHLKVYQKRPIYWLFDSGKKNGFKCLVYMHRWEKDTIARVRTDYVHEMQSRYLMVMDDLTRRVETANGSERVRLQKQLAKVQGQNDELLRYEEKIHHLADQMIAIDLDDGVKHNYAIFEDVLAPIK